MSKPAIAKKAILPYHLDLFKIIGTSDEGMDFLAMQVVRSIPCDDWLGKVTLTDTLMELADDTHGTTGRRKKIIMFIESLNNAWELSRGKRP